MLKAMDNHYTEHFKGFVCVNSEGIRSVWASYNEDLHDIDIRVVLGAARIDNVAAAFSIGVEDIENIVECLPQLMGKGKVLV